MRDTGHTLFMSIKAQRKDGTNISFAVDRRREARVSQLYKDMQNIAAQIKAFKAPVYITFNHEPEASGVDSHGHRRRSSPRPGGMFVTVMRASGVTNAKYVATFTGYGFTARTPQSVNNYYPGDAYVDGVGADVYNWASCKSQPVDVDGQPRRRPEGRSARRTRPRGCTIMEYGSVEGAAGPEGPVAQGRAGAVQDRRATASSRRSSSGPARTSPRSARSATTPRPPSQAAWVTMGHDPAYLAAG